ncbi:MAG TPA: glycosyltransferase [Opitutaceae bacterium]|nr:glycosyltransferase [Opitutaceae bacterium]
MKIILCSAVFSPATQFGGLVTWAAQAAHELAVRGHEVTVLATDLGAKGAPRSEVLPDGVCIERDHGWNFGGLLARPALARVARRAVASADLVVVSGFWQGPVAAVCEAARDAGIPAVLVPHGGLSPWVWARRAPLKRAFFKFRGARAIAAASAVHFVSDREAGTAIGLSADTRRIVSPPGVDFDFWMPDDDEREVARAGAAVSQRKAMLAWAGRFHPVKGLDLLPAAFAPFARLDWELVLVGHDHESEVAASLNRAFADAGIGNKVVFVGGLDAASLRALLRSADGFVLPSLHESFGFAAAEAAACGCAVAVSDACGIAGAAAGDGFAVLPHEPPAWTDWLRAVITRVAGGRRSAGCRERLEPILSMRASWDRTDALYREIAAKR